MTRVTNDEVKALIDTTRDITLFVTNANLIVNEELSDKGLSDERLKLIELYLAAHFVSLTEERGGLVKSKTGDASEDYQLDKGRGYASTRFGQQALDLDSSKTLLSATKTTTKAIFRTV